MGIASPTFAAAIFPDTWKVGRVRLHQLCLGHALLLQRIGNRYAEPQAEPVQELGHLCMAAYVCSRDPEQAARTIDGWWAKNWAVHKAILWGARHAEREREMRLYVAAAWLTPRVESVNRPRQEAKPVGADPVHGLWLHRLQHMGETDAQAMRCPILRARMDLLAWAEQQGAIRIVPDTSQTKEETLLEAAKANADWDRQIRKGGVHG